ncbi:MAG: hypothetical protein GY856_33840 [bacterium]|nr:hypothetical protein [bacterium]
MVARGDLIGAAVLSGIFLSVLAVAELWRRLGQPKPEWTRKLVHLGGGVTCLFFPFLVHSPWVVLVLALAMSGLFAAAAHTGLLGSLHGVERRSRGAEYFPLAVFLVFLMAGERSWLYLAAVLVLAVADAFAALIGSRYGVIRYEVEDEHKTLEGSLVFLIIAFLAVHLPTLLLTELPRVTCVLAAVLVAILVTGFEAISLRGADNLFVPLAVVVVLRKITSQPVPEVVFQNLSLVGICLAVAFLVWRWPFFNVGATIAIILYAYGAWSLASWQWALPVLAGLVCYLVAWASGALPDPTFRIRVRALARALLPPFVVLVIANSARSWAPYYGAYLAANAAVLAFSLSSPVWHLERRGGRRRIAGVVGVTLLATAAIGVPPWLIQGTVAPGALVAIAALVLPATWLVAHHERPRPEPSSQDRTACRFLLCFVVAGGIRILEMLNWAPAWHPG